MNSKAVSALVGLFVVAIVTLTIGLMLFIGDREFSGKDYRRYELLYDSSIKGLSIGAPVTLRGVKIGEVVAVKAKLYDQPQGLLNSVVVDIYPETVVQESSSGESSFGKSSQEDNLINQLLKQGLSAKLGLQSILTGMLYVEVDIFDGQPVTQAVTTDYPQIPTVPNDLEAIFKEFEGINLATIADDLQSTLHNLSKLSGDSELSSMAANINTAVKRIDQVASSLDSSVSGIQKDFSILAGSIDQLTQQLHKELPETSRQLNATLAQLQLSMVQLDNTLIVVSDTVSSDSPLVYQLKQSSKDIGRASRAIEDLSGMLENQPDSLLFGRRGVVR